MFYLFCKQNTKGKGLTLYKTKRKFKNINAHYECKGGKKNTSRQGMKP